MSGVVVPLDTQIPLYRKEYTSPEQTITSAGSLTLAHGLGVKPAAVRTYLVCKITELGYSVGDEVEVADHAQASAASNTFGISLVLDAAIINIRYGAYVTPILVSNKTTGELTAVTNANWRLVVRAWAEPAPTLPEIFTKSFETPEQAITASTSVSHTHGLGAAPSMFQTYIRCKIAEGGYAVGDEIAVVPDATDTTQYGVTTSANATQITICTAPNQYVITPKAGGAAIVITTANWKFFARAWR